LQQLEQSNPTQYTQVTQQISKNLQSAAQTATASGNTSAASQLNQLATDFANASASGQLPNLQDLASAVGGHHGRHHHFGGDSASSASAASPGSASQAFLTALQGTGTQSGSSGAAAIIENTLANAGVS
jgi:hypothetical protein